MRTVPGSRPGPRSITDRLHDLIDDTVAQPAAEVAVDPPPSPVDADGIARGCRRPGSITVEIPGGIVLKDASLALPSWVQATNDPRTRDHRERPREVTGRLASSNNSREDFPLAPWHESYDWNFHLTPDAQHRNLLSTRNVADGGQLECEWEEKFFPSWARPWGVGNRIWVCGRWIYDCGHPKDTSRGPEYRTEIHPPRGVATFVRSAVRLPGNANPTRATQAVVYLGSHGGYFDTDITDRDYEFVFQLPPKPRTAGVEPRFSVNRRTALPAPPDIAYLGGRDVRVTIPLRGATAELLGRTVPVQEYGVVISAGWSDPDGSQAAEIVRRKVTLDTLFMDANLDPVPLDRDEWYVYLGVNGHWWDYKSLGGESKKLNRSVTLLLHRRDPIEISVSGFEADTLHDKMGASIGVSKDEIGKPGMSTSRAVSVAGKIRNELWRNFNQNDKLEHLVIRHSASTTGTFTRADRKKAYRLRYTLS